MRVSIFSELASAVFINVAAAPDNEGEDGSLDEVARDEREYVRDRLRTELSREPSDEEIDEWLREQTEGY